MKFKNIISDCKDILSYFLNICISLIIILIYSLIYARILLDPTEILSIFWKAKGGLHYLITEILDKIKFWRFSLLLLILNLNMQFISRNHYVGRGTLSGKKNKSAYVIFNKFLKSLI